VAERQIARLNKLKSERDNARVEKILHDLREAASTDQNLMPFFIEAVREYATLGEICDVLREIFGEYQQSIAL
jgi:methylmalonyl-CoA mutase N-terminal domain/subunit